MPLNVAEGKNVLLLVHNLPQGLQAFYWYKETTDNNNLIAQFKLTDNTNRTGPAYSGREIMYSNGSLLFQNVTKNDEGTYTLSMLHQDYQLTHEPTQFYVHRK